ncbi:MAG: LysR family transcriptional regulator [Gammaproteobacteria bacterium]
MPVSFEELQAFVAVADSGGFSPAAKRLQITTNAVSVRVRKLEHALGVQLFVRTTRSVSLTNEGTVFLERAATILADLESAQEAVLSGKTELRGTVRLAMPGAIATAPFLACIRELLDANPRLLIQARIINTPVSLAAEGLDIAVTVGAPADSSFIGRPLGRVRWVLVASPAYLAAHGTPRVPQDLARHRCLRLLAYPAQNDWTLVDRKGGKITVPIASGYEADDSRALGDAVYAGIGIGIRPMGELRSAQAAGQLVRVLPKYWFEPLEVFALVPRGRTSLPRIAACLEALRQAVAALA